jgi:hypothetical protein
MSTNPPKNKYLVPHIIAKSVFVAMSNAPKGFAQPHLTNVILGSKRKQVLSAAEAGQSIAELASKKARLREIQSLVLCSGSSEDFEYEDMGTGEEVESIQPPTAAGSQTENVEVKLGASVPPL